MLTKDERKFLESIREQLDDEQKEAFDEMSDEEKKELLRQTNKTASSPKTRIQLIREMSCWEFVKANSQEYGPINAAGAWLLIRMFGTKKGCGCLILLILIGIIVIIIAANAANS